LKDPYEILQVSQNAEIEVIEAAYRRLARKYHPDANPSPDATQRMQDINWAYELLRNPLERDRYNRMYKRSTSSGTYSTPKHTYTESSYTTRSARPQYEPRPSTPRSAAPKTSSQPQPKKTFFQKYWLLILIGFAAYVYFTNYYSPSSGQTSVSPSRASSVESVDPYADCISWTMTGLYDGQRKCVLGEIILVTHEFDSISGSDVWTGYFGMNPETGFHVISVDRDISKWEGECVVVYGTLFEREKIREYVENPAPSMVDSDPYDDRGFSISTAPSEQCN
jgi:hypothetical protein